MPDLAYALPILEKVFEDLANIAGLELNLPKCVLIPLWPTADAPLMKTLCDVFSWWSRVSTNSKGTYLGFVIGPGADESSWDKPLKKCLASARFWGKSGVGLQYAACAYTIYVLPI